MAGVTVTRCLSRSTRRSGPGSSGGSRRGRRSRRTAGWREIAAGRHTLIAAPTGSGKTLAAFLVCIDRLYRAHEAAHASAAPARAAGGLRVAAEGAGRRHPAEPGARRWPRSPTWPRELGLSRAHHPGGGADRRHRGRRAGRDAEAPARLPDHHARVAVPAGDRGARAGPCWQRPDRDRGRDPRRGREQARLAPGPDPGAAGARRRRDRVQRIGPVGHRSGRSSAWRGCWSARATAGNPDGSPRCSIVDSGHRRAPRPGPGAARRRAGRGRHRRADGRDPRPDRRPRAASTGPRWCSSTPGGCPSGSPTSWASGSGDGQVAAHHGACPRSAGSGSRPGCAAGDLRALVATASLELGIDIGPVELVCQIGSPRSFATFLQRVGRSNHSAAGRRAGMLYPTTRDELVECAALLRGVRAGRLDAHLIPDAPAGHPGPADRGRVRGRATGPRRTCWRWCGGPRRSPDLSRARTSTRSPSWCPRGSAPGAAAGPPTCTATRSTGGCAAGAEPGSPRSPPAGPSPSWATTGCWPSPTRPRSAR